jgi:hypothetical protein
MAIACATGHADWAASRLDRFARLMPGWIRATRGGLMPRRPGAFDPPARALLDGPAFADRRKW